MIPCVTMTDFETGLDKRFEDIDVDSILSRVGNNKALSISRKRCLLRAPEFIQRLPAEDTVEEGSSVTFSCKLVGLPKPTVTWFKDDDVIGPEARAKTDSDNTGLHSLQLGDVSRCDVGTYKIKASNSEGSSANSLYLSVKAKSKSRNRKKKKKSRAVACAPMFPAIVEHHAEEQRETLEVEKQPESPLTPLYTNISRKSPVTWPEFLGDWGYCLEDDKHDVMDLDVDCEDVFDSDADSPTTTCPSMTFVSSAYSKLNEDNVGKHNYMENDSFNSNKELEIGNSHENEKNKNENTRLNNVSENIADKNNSRDIRSASLNDVLNNNEKNRKMNEDKPGRTGESTRKSREDMARRAHALTVPCKDIEEKTIYCDATTVSKIAVNRSYATGDSTFSVARRSPSPYPHTREQTLNGQNPASMGNAKNIHIRDTPTLQNLNNERILMRMKKSGSTFLNWNYFFISSYRKCDEDHILELFFMLCGGTFLALLLDLHPSTFVFNVLIALVIRVALNFILDDT